MWGEDLEVDGLAIDAFVVAGDPRGLVLNFPLNIAEIVEPPVRDMMKLSPFIRGSLGGVPVAGRYAVLGVVFGDIDQLENERSSGDDAASAG